MNIRRLVLALILVCLPFGTVRAAPNQQLGFSTAVLKHDLPALFPIVSTGSVLVYRMPSSLVAYNLINGQTMLEIPLNEGDGYDVSLVGEELAWLDATDQLHVVNVWSRQETTRQFDPSWNIVAVDLTTNWFVVTRSFANAVYSQIELVQRTTGEHVPLVYRSYGPTYVREQSVVWLEKVADAHAFGTLYRYDLTTHRTEQIADYVPVGSPVDLDAGRVLYIRDGNVNIYDLASDSQHTFALPYPYHSKMQLRGDFVVGDASPPGAGSRTLFAYHWPTGALRVLTTRADYDDWTLTTNSPSEVIWRSAPLAGGVGRGDLMLTALSLVAPPAAMEPEVAAGTPGSAYFETTKHNLAAPFSTYWWQNGGLAQFGYPLSARFDEVNADTNTAYPTQYLERQRFEWHAENAGTAYEVLLGRLGAELLVAQGRDWRREGPDQPGSAQFAGECQTFDITQRTVCGSFLIYWRTHGLDFDQRGVSYDESLALFGLPLTEPRYELNPDGDWVLTQWFERARFEYHPDNAEPYKVLLGRLGSEVLSMRGWQP